MCSVFGIVIYFRTLLEGDSMSRSINQPTLESHRATVSSTPSKCSRYQTIDGESAGYSTFSSTYSCSKLCEFLGLINFYHCFIPKCADILQPLNDLLSSSASKSNMLNWTDATITAFRAAKEALVNTTLLMHPKLKAPNSLMVDAYNRGAGAILQQYIEGE